MREIKFRAWDGNKLEHFDLQTLYWRGEDSGEYDFPAGLKVMQYTGLKDKNGKEIYEGDIIDLPWVEQLLAVKYDWGLLGFIFSPTSVPAPEANAIRMSQVGEDRHIYAGRCEIIEVVGNIYENAELLEDGDAKD